MSDPGRVNPRSLRLVAVTDSLRGGVEGLALRAAAAVAGGATMITLRLPGEPARLLAEAARALHAMVPGIPLLVSGRADVAFAVEAAGVHLGSDDLPASVVRGLAPPGFVIAASIGTMAEVPRAAGADFVAIGPVFAASRTTGADDASAMGLVRFTELARACALPAVAIGGISPSNAGSLMDAGAAGVAVISALLGAADPTLAARELRRALDASGR